MKKVLLAVIAIAWSVGLLAAPVSQESAQKVAEKFYRQYAPGKSTSVVADIITRQKDGVNTYYIFIFSEGGFVMVAADDVSLPVLGFSTDEPFDINNIPSNAQYWFDQYSEQIKYLVDNGADNSTTLPEWTTIRNGQLSSAKFVVNPLCSTLWDQSYPFNNLCPGGSYTGCVATAMAQIMKKWNYPTNGTGTHTYNDPTYGSQTVNYGATTYSWANMINDYSGTSTSAQRTAVATLMYHCGVGVDMQYSTSGSGAYTWDVPSALINFFAYSPSAEFELKADFSSTEWINMIKNELDAGRPVFYSGDDGSTGHAFVADGYNSSSQLHFNWGWSGSSNGYYAVGNLNPMGENFNLDNMVVIRIMPPLGQPVANFTASTTTPAVGGSVTFADASTNSPTNWTWTFTGGSPSTYTGQTPPAITYSVAGQYTVILTASNTNGTDTKTRIKYIDVGGTPSAWIKQNSGFATASRGISTIYIVNPYIAWAGAIDGTSATNYIQEFTRTEDGGATWTPGTITFTGSTTYGIANMHAFNDTICFAAMFPGSAANGGYVAKTTNGGTSWSIANSPSFSSSWLDFVYFFDQSNGVCMGDPSGTDFVIYTTSNGGTSWTQVAPSTLPNCSSGEAGITDQFDAVGNTIWFGTSMGRIYKSTDKGLTWTVTSTGLGTTAVVTPVFKDANTGIAIGTSNSTGAYIGMKKTTNGGSTWTTVTPSGYFVKIPHLDFVPGSNMWVEGASGPGTGSSYSTTDCSSFLNIDTASTVQYTAVKFYDINTGWAGSFNTSSTDGGIYKWNPGIITAVDNVPDIFAEHVILYPNPACQQVNVQFAGFSTNRATVSVFNLMGEKIMSTEVDPLTHTILPLDLSRQSNGVYIITVDTGENLYTEKLTLVNGQ